MAMPTDKQMQHLGRFGDFDFYLADESFKKPGVYYWNGKRNVNVLEAVSFVNAASDEISNCQLIASNQEHIASVMCRALAIIGTLCHEARGFHPMYPESFPATIRDLNGARTTSEPPQYDEAAREAGEQEKP
jgi:hypothetical protein